MCGSGRVGGSRARCHPSGDEQKSQAAVALRTLEFQKRCLRSGREGTAFVAMITAVGFAGHSHDLYLRLFEARRVGRRALDLTRDMTHLRELAPSVYKSSILQTPEQEARQCLRKEMATEDCDGAARFQCGKGQPALPFVVYGLCVYSRAWPKCDLQLAGLYPTFYSGNELWIGMCPE
ncbi:hypothetical protein NDU88_004243 [Pleurodeles waltl]|uniref:Uncharacterized protein n=1 Tax=Pleurodeles waltl TaxID=8319 RepID=A0AAV7RHK5_PLEWA|nr:hypothetical protein NDU88_004243 [Pleurodeles waltl]